MIDGALVLKDVSDIEHKAEPRIVPATETPTQATTVVAHTSVIPATPSSLAPASESSVLAKRPRRQRAGFADFECVCGRSARDAREDLVECSVKGCEVRWVLIG